MPLDLTLPDLVVLSLLAERPMHGYELNQELERREVRDWAGISRPQVYYSLKKLARSGHLAKALPAGGSAGPERQVWRISAAGRRGLAQALAREEWAVQRPPPPFLTWMALSPFADPADRSRLLRRRRAFLEEQIAKERTTLEAILRDSGPMVAPAAQIVRLAIRQWEIELEWLAEVAGDAGHEG
ncbi:MAG TPA: PadR family transcriptional regulator [Gemmatimonadales bacterium]|jgi:DNA-binding PadR family transcriptional regulator|nr:PadR family transcriptional regulator [Gemmatimonadales bacterium]